MLLETYKGTYIEVSRRDLERAARQELIRYLESRGCACYDHETTQLLRESALDDWDCEYGN